jgi:hypothetical protein
MPRIGGHRAVSKPPAPAVSKTGTGSKSTTPAQKTPEKAPPQVAPQVSDQQKAQRKLEKQVSGEIKRAVYRGKEKMGAYYKASPETHAQMQKVSQEMNSELSALYKKYPNIDPETGKRRVAVAADRERLNLLEPLADALKTSDKANPIARAIAENKDHPLYKHWGPTKFSSFVALSNANLAKSGAPTHGMTTMERAALIW